MPGTPAIFVISPMQRKSNMFTRLFRFAIAVMVLSGCADSDTALTHYPYNPRPYPFVVPEDFPVILPAVRDSTTVAGVDLGRHLFYDTRLSGDGTMSCASCHLPGGNFTDNRATAPGIRRQMGTRSPMALLDLVHSERFGLGWAGDDVRLHAQARRPVEDSLELFGDWPTIEARLRRDTAYHRRFRAAYGITQVAAIDRERILDALAQFERSITSTGQSKYDRFRRGEVALTSDEYMGYDLFFDDSPEVKDTECAHCHIAPLLSGDDYFNNGIEPVRYLSDFPDRGRGAITGDSLDNGKFKAPTLRNIALSAPYMHDGRFATLEEVIDHYNSGGHYALNKSPLVRPLGLTETEQGQLLAFLHTLTDTAAINRAALQNPFGR